MIQLFDWGSVNGWRQSGHGLLTLCFVLLGLGPAISGATPLGGLVKRDGGAGNHDVKIWAPIVAVVGAAFVLFLGICCRGSLRAGWNSMGEAAAMASGAGTTTHGAPATRELTAAELAGGRTSSSNNTTTTGAPTTTQGRRTGRRNRRTPSQISTRSLPVYQKEPGDQELVIYRGQDAEDEPEEPTTVIMPPVAEDGEGNLTHSRNGSHNSQLQYGNLPDSPQNMSLMQGDETLDPTMDTSTRHLIPPAGLDNGRGSFDTMHESEESTSSLMAAVQGAVSTDPRGEAPPYFEVDEGGARQEMPSPTTAQNPASATTPPSSATVGTRPSTDSAATSTGSRRLSGFRSLLHTLTNTNRPPIPPIPQDEPTQTPGHNRNQSALSATSHLSSEMHERAPGSTSRMSHRPTNSTGSVWRTISRQKSHNTLNSAHLNSPSMISLNSISAPLSHTLTRTEISYPASGPTAEQMRLISSRESFARFGVPYGADAIAYAASTSRHDLEPTPDYETHHGTGSTSLLPNANPNATRSSSSPLAGLPDTSESPVEVQQQHSRNDSSSSDSLQEAPAPAAETTEVVEPVSEPKPEPEPTPSSPPVESSPPNPQPEASASAAAAAADPAPPASSISPPAKTDTLKPTLATPIPPSAFKAPLPAGHERPASRADSLMSAVSYATAEESIYDSAPSGAQTPEPGYEEDVPVTPHGATFHAHTHENTDTTITQGTVP